MEEDISIIDTNTRIEKIKNFFIKNKKYLITILSLIILIIFAFFAYNEMQNKKNKNLAEKYNDIIINFESTDKSKFKKELVEKGFLDSFQPGGLGKHSIFKISSWFVDSSNSGLYNGIEKSSSLMKL